MQIQITATGTTPLLMHNPRMVDPEYDLNREIKGITSKRKKTDDDLHAIARLEWFGGLYYEDGRVTQPTAKLRKCIVEAGRIHKLGKQVERALTFETVNVPLTHDGGNDPEKLYASGKYISRLSVGVNGKRVMRVRPQFNTWTIAAPALFLEDVMNIDELTSLVKLAGRAVGIGDNRVNGYGRFNAEVEVLG